MAVLEALTEKERSKVSAAIDEWYEAPPHVWGRELEKQVREAQFRSLFVRAMAEALAAHYKKAKAQREAEAKRASVAPEVEQKFRALAEEWYVETMPLSSYLEKILHPAYQKILTLGEAVVPLILRELQEMPNDWFWALRILTSDDPVTPEQAGDMEAMARAWVEWGRKKGLV